MSQIAPSNSFIIPLITGCCTLIIGILIEKFKNRISYLQYSVLKQPLATPSQSNNWGDIRVLHNGQETKQLHFVTVSIENTTNVDHQNMNITLGCDSNSQILAHDAFYTETTAIIALEKEFEEFVKSTNQQEDKFQNENSDINKSRPINLEQHLGLIKVNRRFYIPVLNRKDKLTFHLLIENLVSVSPDIKVNIIHKSTKLKQKEDADMEMIKTIVWAFGLGIVIYAIIYFVLISIYPESRRPITISGVFGILYSAMGLIVYYIGKWVYKLFK